MSPSSQFLEALRRRRSAEDLLRPALRSPAGTLTYAALFDRVTSGARQLLDAGLRRGDRVVLRAPNSPDFVVGLLAIMAAGGIATPVASNAGSRQYDRGG